MSSSKKKVILVPSKCVLNDLAFGFPRMCTKLFTSIPPQRPPVANVPERKLFRCFQCFCHTLFHMRNLTYHTEKPKHNIQYLCFGKKILSKLYAHNSFKETNSPVGK